MAMMNEMEYRTIGSALAGGYRAAVYCRLSKDDDLQGESASIANQRDMLEKYCEKQGWEVVAVYQDDGFTGLNIANPVFFNELMNTHYMQAIIKPLTVRAAQPHINSEQVQNLPMLVVPLQEQEQFATFVRQSDKSKLLISRLKEFILMGYQGHGKM